MDEITFIGSGNIATQLGIAFYKSNITIKQIISRNKESGKILASKLKSNYSDDVKSIQKTDLIIIAVQDDNIKEIIKNVPNYPIVHTSGNTNINALKDKSNYGVIYPVQTIEKGNETDFKKIPICIFSNES